MSADAENPPPSAVRPVIVGVAGPTLSAAERALFERLVPFGFILFARNIQDPGQVTALNRELAALLPHTPAPILIDQEGGRVQRLKPPHWRQAPPAADVAALYARDPEAGLRAATLNARLMAEELRPLGFSVDCAPCLDLARPETHVAIGNRAHGADPDQVSALGRAVIEGLEAGGLLPVIKHMPGHGRATVDSHLQLPRIEAGRSVLEASDFRPFRTLAERVGLGMTGHLLLPAFDPDRPATVSPAVIDWVIRQEIGFDGLLLSDDLCMQALAGGPGDRVAACLAAGCDIALYCSGDLEENRQALAAAPAIAAPAWQRWNRALARCRPVAELDAAAALNELQGLMSA